MLTFGQNGYLECGVVLFHYLDLRKFELIFCALVLLLCDISV